MKLFLRNVTLFLLSPFIGLAYVFFMPWIGVIFLVSMLFKMLTEDTIKSVKEASEEIKAICPDSQARLSRGS